MTSFFGKHLSNDSCWRIFSDRYKAGFGTKMVHRPVGAFQRLKLGAPFTLETAFLRWYIDKSYEFWHFFHVSTNWQGNRESQIAGLSEDPDARDLLSKTLGQPTDRVAGYIEK